MTQLAAPVDSNSVTNGTFTVVWNGSGIFALTL